MLKVYLCYWINVWHEQTLNRAAAIQDNMAPILKNTYSGTERLNSIDFARGIVMIIMALDHVRDLIHVDALTQDPTNLATTSTGLFLTRWITYLCAPIFVFLAGTSAYLALKKTNDYRKSRRFLLGRGIWLIILEFTLVNFGIWFDIHFNVFIFQVIAAIGLGFVVLGLVLKTSPKTLGIIGLLISCLHNVFPLIPFPESALAKTILTPFFSPLLLSVGSATNLLIAYPPVPWIAILLIGYGLGSVFEMAKASRRKFFLSSGGVFLVLFVLLRFKNLYGDPSPWSTQDSTAFSILSFINVTKYPPSLLYVLLMLGIMFLVLFFAERWKGKLMAVVIVYGKVPLFYYLVHWYIIHFTLFAILFLQGFDTKDFRFGFSFGRPEAPSGLELWAIYGLWVGIVAILYPLCNWYGRYKSAHPEKWWLKYI